MSALTIIRQDRPKSRWRAAVSHAEGDGCPECPTPEECQLEGACVFYAEEESE